MHDRLIGSNPTASSFNRLRARRNNLACILLCVASSLAIAQVGSAPTTGSPRTNPTPGAAPNSIGGGGGGGGSTTFTTNYFEGSVLARAGEAVTPLGPELMGDKINLATGSLEFHQTDTSLPGNSLLPVAVGRVLQTGQSQPTLVEGLFGDWELEIPHLHTLSGGLAQNGTTTPDWYGSVNGTTFNESRCSQFFTPPVASGSSGSQAVAVSPNYWWDGYHLYIPGSGDQTLLSRLPFATANPSSYVVDPIQPSDGNAYPVLTKENWQFRCLASMANNTGEAFLGRAPDGSTYQFDHMVTRAYVQYGSAAQGATVNRGEVWVLPSTVTDRFGNTVTYTYDTTDPWKVLSIQSSDGRIITFTYVSGTHRVQTVFDGTRTWTYGYNGSGALQSVTLPDSSAWQFSLRPLEHSPYYFQDPTCNTGLLTNLPDANTYSGTMVHPSGATATFATKFAWHGRTNVPGSFAGCPGGAYVVGGVTYHNLWPTYTGTYSLQSKTLSGPGISNMTWSYAYGTGPSLGLPAGCFQSPTNCNTPQTVQVTDPLGNVTQDVYGTEFGLNEGLLVQSSEGYSSSGSLRVTSYTYACPSTATYPFPCTAAGPYPSSVGYNGSINDDMGGIYTPQSSAVITQQGATFSSTVSGFDAYVRPTGATRASSLGYTKTDATTYYDNTAIWMLGQVATTSTNGIQSTSTTFNTTTAVPLTTSRFGKLVTTFAFNGDGTLYSVADGLGNTTKFSSYVRGIPQTIGYADGTSQSAVVNNLALLTSVTNEAGTTWTYGYDSMGRLASETPPTGDPVNYNPKILSFVQVPGAEYGIAANHWRQTITLGNAVTANYFDARWRKLMTLTYDSANQVGTQRMQLFSYDPYNRTTFASYPAQSISGITSTPAGVSTSYDALGRPAQTQAASEIGTLTTGYQYLTGFQRKVTNPRGYATTTAFQAFDVPSESAPSSIAAPEGVNVGIVRDVFGKPSSITRSGAYGGSTVSATRSYVYDANQVLCKTIEPEIGSTVQTVDAANNVSWKAIGVALPGTTTCDTASVPSSKMIAFSYDKRNRLTGTGFADGSPSIGRSYTPDGLPLTVVSNGTTWTYYYNNHRLLTGELLSDGWAWWLMYGYDANAHESSVIYPDSTSLSFSPDALGEPTQLVGTLGSTTTNYAIGVTYWPNGGIAGYTLGNGIVHSQSQNTRGLPAVNRDSGVLQDQYTYDQNGNVATITDLQQGITNRTMSYDGLDRLATANAPNVWGAGTYGYDPLDNLRTAVVGTRNSALSYDSTNRVSTILTNGTYTGYSYDGQGNVNGRGTQGYYFDQGNRMTLANNQASYVYDGLGRRVTITYANGNYELQMYSQAGQMMETGFQAGSLVYHIEHIYLGGKEIAESNSSTGTTYVHTDTLGSPVAWTNSIGGLVTQTRFEPFGNTAAGAVPNGIGFTGHVSDPNTGLVYMQQRYYDPIAGRFLSTDPVTTDEKTGDLFNRYVYGRNNPYRYTDPDGRLAFLIPVAWAIFEAVTTATVVEVSAAAVGVAGAAIIVNAAGSSGGGKTSTLTPGPNAGDSVPARGPGRDFTPGERQQVNEIGDKTGCHTCGAETPGTKSGNWVPDHQPPSSQNPEGAPQRLYPHCLQCSRTQGGEARQAPKPQPQPQPKPPEPKPEAK